MESCGFILGFQHLLSFPFLKLSYPLLFLSLKIPNSKTLTSSPIQFHQDSTIKSLFVQPQENPRLSHHSHNFELLKMSQRKRTRSTPQQQPQLDLESVTGYPHVVFVPEFPNQKQRFIELSRRKARVYPEGWSPSFLVSLSRCGRYGRWQWHSWCRG
ncbi:uncharacterized protein LOC110686644 [Chenopodium quinoa]|uniref:uncharacterized protein LOC110686644 n=1 Tax=Chenopodium quinoa TaxID=63459 RepID=UPI000B78A3EE|nr:uncharacterized protein LOC110686644 [Chenopodium quinoa]